MKAKSIYRCIVALLFFTSLTNAQVNGIVVDDFGPLEGAVVTVSSTGLSTETDIDGKFEIKAALGDELSILNPSTLAQTDIVVTQYDLGSLSVVGGAIELTKIVTLGYGVQESQEQRTAAYNTVSAEDIERVSSVSIDQALQGQVPGLNTGAISGQPGGYSATFIRGITSLTSSTNPLFVIDGVPVLSGDNAGIATSSNPLANIDPNTIKEVTVLKDASATSLYGARGANGVILITLKKGARNTSNISFSTELGFGGLAYDELDVLNSTEHADYIATALFNAGYFNTYQDAYDYNYLDWDGETNTDWRAATRNKHPLSQRYSFLYAGGGENVQLSSNLSYFKQEGIAKKSYFERISGYLGANIQASDRLSIETNMAVSKSTQGGPTDGSAFSNPIFTGAHLAPGDPIYNDDGSYNLNTNFLNPQFNPVAITNTNINQSKFYKILSTFNANYEILEGLNFSSNFGADFNVFDELLWWNPDFGDGVNNGDPNGDGYGLKTDRNFFTWSWANSLNYSKKFAEIHNVNATIAIEKIRGDNRFTLAEAQGYPSGYTLPHLTNAANPTDAFSNETNFSFNSYIARLGYTLLNRYTLTGTFRRDGSSRFGAGKQYGDFFSAGGSWNIDEEEFLKNSVIINKLKLRAGWGQVGNAEIGNYKSRSNYIPSSGSYGLANSGSVDVLGNEDLGWETTTSSNFGLDYSLFTNKISGSFDYYIKNTDDLLFESPIPGSATGIKRQIDNIGEVESKGFEVLLNVAPIRNEEFSLNFSFNYSYNQSEVLALSDSDEYSINGFKNLAVGHNPSEYYLRLWAGIDPENGLPLWYTNETRTETTSNSAEALQSFTGENALPKHIAGLTTNLSYKGFSLAIQLFYKGDYSVYDRWGFVYNSNARFGYLNPVRSAYDNAWSPDNPNGTAPQLIWGDPYNASAASTRYLYDGSHIRLRSIEFGYDLKNKFLTENTGISNVYLFVKGFNIATWAFDDDLFFDPEAGSNAYDTDLEGAGVYDLSSPNLKQYSFGVKMEF